MATRVTVSFPDEFLVEVDRVAQAEHRSRSDLVREAVRLYIARKQQEARPDAERAIPRTMEKADQQARIPGDLGEASSEGIHPIREARQGVYEPLADPDRDVAREFRRRLTQIMPIVDLWVFGSRARGDAAPGADLDLFIEVEAATPEVRQQISEIAWEVGFEMERVISTVVVTRDQLEHGAMGASPLVREVEREGIRP